jgi:molecular chaperone DnaK
MRPTTWSSAPEKLLSENADKINDDVKQPVEEAIAEVKSALEGEDNDRVKAAVEKLNTTSAQLGQAMYAAAQAAQQQAPSEAGEPSEHAESNGESSASEDDVVDAEIVDDDQTSSEAR